MTTEDGKDDFWSDLVEMARAHVAKAEAGDARMASRVLEQSAVALRGVIRGEIPDRERIEYLRFLLAALEEIGKGVKAARALGLGESGRPTSISPDRYIWLFFAVGLKYDGGARA